VVDDWWSLTNSQLNELNELNKLYELYELYELNELNELNELYELYELNELNELFRTIPEFLVRAIKKRGDVFAGLAADVLPDQRIPVFFLRPSKTMAIFPDKFVGLFFVLSLQVLSFMEKNGRALGLVHRVGEKIGVDRHYLKREIGRGISIFLRHRGVQPVVLGSKGGHVIEHENLVRKPLFVEYCDSFSDLDRFGVAKTARGHDQRQVKPEDRANYHYQADDNAPQYFHAGPDPRLLGGGIGGKHAVAAGALFGRGEVHQFACRAFF
jgi:hypothetical protein